MGRVLIAEDEVINRMYIVSLLNRRNIGYSEVSTAAEAWDELQEGGYDLLLLDLGLPDMDGLELAQRLRTSSNNIPIIAVTGRDYPEDREAMFQAGIEGIIAKPIQEYVFFQEIERVLDF